IVFLALNASRHHRKNRSSGCAAGTHLSWCSTPRDITGKIAFRFRDSRQPRASCSTPRGITGKIASHDPAIKDAEEGAQRLAASPEKSLSGIQDRRPIHVCAQRLAASPEKSRLSFNRLHYACPVLNASRHHRKNRATHRNHHRFHGPACSTPRGITGKIAQSRSSLESHHRVLNASRHHRKNRTRMSSGMTLVTSCSTPRGITGKIARSRTRRKLRLRCAQRLAASPEKSRRLRRDL